MPTLLPVCSCNHQHHQLCVAPLDLNDLLAAAAAAAAAAEVPRLGLATPFKGGTVQDVALKVRQQRHIGRSGYLYVTVQSALCQW
jgi:hypothetical protein